MLINGWIVLGLFIVVAVGILVVAIGLRDEIDHHKTFDHSLHSEISQDLNIIRVEQNLIKARLDALEKPYATTPVETKVCPECNEEKDVVEGDYICKDCRDLDIAA